MATKLTVPRPGPRADRAAKVQAEKKTPPRVAPLATKPPEAIALEASDVVEEIDITEPSPPPVVVPEPEPPPAPRVAAPAAIAPPQPVILPPPPPAPVDYPTPIWLTPTPEPPRAPMRSMASSTVSEFERDSIRKSSPPVAERRKQLQKLVASAVGVAWFICLVAVGQTALRTIIASMSSP